MYDKHKIYLHLFSFKTPIIDTKKTIKQKSKNVTAINRRNFTYDDEDPYMLLVNLNCLKLRQFLVLGLPCKM